MKRYLKTLLVILFLVTWSAVNAVNVRLSGLKCEHLYNPVGIDDVAPRLSWQLEDSRKGAVQAAYRIIVGKDSEAVSNDDGDVWDTGKILGADMLVRYSGKALEPFTGYWWKVIAWDKDGRETASDAAYFETGMMGMENWQGQWISDGKDIEFCPAPYFRKEFMAEAGVKHAMAYISAAGLYELYINGRKVGDHRLDPLYTRFDRRNLYVAYDVTDYLHEGRNAVGVLLGNGWYNHQSGAVWDFDRAPWRNRPAFCLDLRICGLGGDVMTVVSGDDWKTGYGPLVFNSIYTSEHYDARLGIDGWAEPGFDDSAWCRAVVRDAPSGNVTAQKAVPIRNVTEYKARSVRKLDGNSWLYDFGQNMSGVTRLRLAGEEGTKIRLIHTERLHPDGHADQSNIDVYFRPKNGNDFFQTDIVTLSGNGEDEFMPRFNYKGFRYVEVVTDRPMELNADNLTAYFMHSDVEPAGELETSEDIVNRLWKATNMSYLSNLMGYPTDCPQREKNGWTGDGHLAIETGLYNFDAITVYEKWMADHRDEQRADGVLPDIIPTGGWGYGTDNGLDWTSTIAIIPWTLYTFYGDVKPLEDCYENIKRYVDYVDRNSPDGLSSWGRGDWVPVKSRSSLELTSSVYFFVDATILSKAAMLLGKEEDFRYYSSLADKICNAINDKYLDREKGIYASGTQTELSVPLYWGVAPQDVKAAVAANLAADVEAKGYHIDVGVLGARAVLNALSENGYHETAYRLAVQDTYPSWGNWIVNGDATTLLENWDLNAPRDISDNHMMFGDIGGWFFRGLAGIRPDSSRPGFRHIVLTPAFLGPEKLSAGHVSPYGRISVSWKLSKGKARYHVEVPAGCTATLMLPGHVEGAGRSMELCSGTHDMTFRIIDCKQ
ncbi:MAG: glycoside hydrolase family 78 protein [Bacteroidales bacterium]|nr:glycoside hydrolase family 78 protein [Bacteroidales bacterium]